MTTRAADGVEKTERKAGERPRSTAPSLGKFLPLPFGFVSRLRANPGFLLDATRSHGDVVRFEVGKRVFHVIAHPDHVRHVLVDRAKNYPRSRFYEAFRAAIGNGLLANEGASWTRQRRLAQPAFHRRRTAALEATSIEATQALLRRWEPLAARGTTLDVADEMVRLTFTVVARALCSTDVEPVLDEMGRAAVACSAYVNYRMNRAWAPPLSWPTPRNVRFRRRRAYLDGVVHGILARRRAGERRDDLVSLLMDARDEETGTSMPDEALRDEIVTFVLAGHETVAACLAWTFDLLAANPDAEGRVRDEARRVFGEAGPQAGDASRLPVARSVVEESLRLRPPVWRISRGVLEDDEVGGYAVPAGSVVVLSPYVTHLHPSAWDDPQRFVPERFSPEAVAARPRGAYFPFGAGPHTCIGNEFALTEAVLVVAQVLARVHLDAVPGRAPTPEWGLTLRPKGGLAMTLRPA